MPGRLAYCRGTGVRTARLQGEDHGASSCHQKNDDHRRGRNRDRLLALAILTIVIAAKAWTPEYAFHAYLFAAASVAAVFAIVNRYFSRSAEPVPQEIDGKPNYNYGAGQVRDSGLDGLGHRRLHGRL